MAIGTKPVSTAMGNRHPADELADIRDQIAVLKTRGTKLRNALLSAEQSDRIGEEWIAEITQWKSNRLDNAALKKHFGLEALQPFMRESVTKSIKLISIQTGKRPFTGVRRHPLEAAFASVAANSGWNRLILDTPAGAKATMAPTTKSLAQSNKSQAADKATKKRIHE
jgi:hypothetical protein